MTDLTVAGLPIRVDSADKAFFARRFADYIRTDGLWEQHFGAGVAPHLQYQPAGGGLLIRGHIFRKGMLIL